MALCHGHAPPKTTLNNLTFLFQNLDLQWDTNMARCIMFPSWLTFCGLRFFFFSRKSKEGKKVEK